MYGTKFLALFVLCASALFGQFTIANPTAQAGWTVANWSGATDTVSTAWRQGFADNPYAQEYSITGTASTLAWGSCTGDGPLCGALAIYFCTVASNGDPCSTTTTSPALLFISFGTTNALTAGNHTSTFHITGSTNCNAAASCWITITYNAVAATAPVIKTLSGTTAGFCINTGLGYPDTCNYNYPLGLGGTFVFPSAGGSWTDDSFGGTAMAVSSAVPGAMRTQPCDAIMHCINADDSLVVQEGISPANEYITNISTQTDLFMLGANSFSGWDPVNPKVFWNGFSYSGSPGGLHVIKNDFTSGSIVQTTYYTYTPTGGANNISNSGDGNVTADGWLALGTSGGTDQKLILLNLNTYPATAYTVGLTHSDYRWAQALGGCDSVTNERYVVVTYNSIAEASEIYGLSCSALTLAFVQTMPLLAGTQTSSGGPWLQGAACPPGAMAHAFCPTSGHHATMMLHGQAYYIPAFQSQNPYTEWSVMERINAGNAMAIPQEAGGGMLVGLQITGGTGTCNCDVHTSAVDGGASLMSTDADPEILQQSNTQFSDVLLSMSTGSNPTVAYYSPAINSFLTNLQTTSGKLVLGAVQGCTGVNGIAFTISSLNTTAQTFVANGITSSGTCTNATGGFVANYIPQQVPNQTGVWMVDWRAADTTKVVTVTRLPNTRSFSMYNYLLAGVYWQEAKCSLSVRTAAWATCSAGALPDTVQTIVMATGFSATLPSLSGKNVLSGKNFFQ